MTAPHEQVGSIGMDGSRVRVILHVDAASHLAVREAMRKKRWWLCGSAWEDDGARARMEFAHDAWTPNGSPYFTSSDDVNRSVKRAIISLGMGAEPVQPAASTDAYLAALQRSMVSMTPVAADGSPVMLNSPGTARAMDAPRVNQMIPAQVKGYFELRADYILHGGGIAALEAMKEQVKGSVSEDGEWTWDPAPEAQDSRDPSSPVPPGLRKGPDGKFLMPKEDYLRQEGLLPPLTRFRSKSWPCSAALALICLAVMIFTLVKGELWGLALAYLAAAGLSGLNAWKGSRRVPRS